MKELRTHINREGEMETNNIILFDHMTLLSGLSHDTACQVLESMRGSPALQYVEVAMRSQGDHTWDIVAECYLLRGVFLKDPEKFVVTLNDDLVKKINEEQRSGKDAS